MSDPVSTVSTDAEERVDETPKREHMPGLSFDDYEP
jgi:hypothetical protein